MTQVLNKKLYAKMSNQMSHKIKIITCDKDIFNIDQNINAYGQGSIYKNGVFILYPSKSRHKKNWLC